MSLIHWVPLVGNIQDKCGGTIQAAPGKTLPSTIVTGKLGEGYTFSNNGVQINNVNVTKTMSFAFWVKLSSNSACHILDLRGSTGEKGYQPVYYNTSGIQIYSSAGCNSSYNACSLGTSWHHVVITIQDGAGSLYLDGVYQNTNTTLVGYSGVCHATIGCRCNGNNPMSGILQDVRIYNHILSNKEIYDLAKGLILHYGFESSTTFGVDNSGFGYNGTLSNVSSTSTTSGRGISSAVFNGSSSYIDIPFLKSDILSSNWTIMFWLYSKDNNASGNVNRAVYFGDYGLTDGTKFNIEKTAAGALRIWCNGGSNDISTALTVPYQTWAHIAITYAPGTLKVYLNGELKDTKTVTISSTKSSGGFRLGRDSRTGDTAFNGNMANLKIFTTTLSLEDIKAESKRVKGIDRNGSNYVAAVYELDVDRSCVSKSSVQRVNYLTEVIQLEDGSYWLQVSHHNNKGGTNLFNSADAFETEFVYHNDECWAAFNLIKSHGFYNSKYEFMAFEQLGTGNNFVIRRWSQTVNPFTATYATAKKDSGNFTAISNIPSINGGMYKMDTTNTYFCICNATSGNWYGAFGASNKYGNGIPSFNNSTTAGVFDLFVRISPTDALKYREFQGGVISTFNLIEN